MYLAMRARSAACSMQQAVDYYDDKLQWHLHLWKYLKTKFKMRSTTIENEPVLGRHSL